MKPKQFLIYGMLQEEIQIFDHAESMQILAKQLIIFIFIFCLQKI